jgi:hypothetical protein
MINFLDYKTVEIINDNKIYKFKIIFTTKLKELINTPIVQTYLSELAIDLKEAMDNHSKFDLYQYTLKYAKTRDKVITWLGVLFQDTTFSRVQVQYLDELSRAGKLSKKESDIKDLMEEIAIMLEPKKLRAEEYKTWLRLYPDFEVNDINEISNPSFYHFYPVALWAIHLRVMDWANDYAQVVPFVLNADYEFQSLDPDRWPWRHPDTFKITSKTTYKMRDIYTGLAASVFGAKKDSLLPAFSGFTQKFSVNPYKYMKAWALRL